MNKILSRAKLELTRVEALLKSDIDNIEKLKLFLNHLINIIEHVIEGISDEQEIYFDKHLVEDGYIDEDVFELYYHLKMIVNMNFVKTRQGFKAETWKTSIIIDKELLEDYYKQVNDFLNETLDKQPVAVGSV